MRDWIGEWAQEGRLYVWRHADARRGWRGWQWTGDPAGCRSLRNLLDRMQGGDARHRTLRLEPVTQMVFEIPNAGFRFGGQFAKLRIEYRPEADALRLEPNDEALILTVGPGRLRKLSAALGRVEIGDGDFGIDPGGRGEDSWMFWWMPDVDYSDRKKL